MRCIMINTNRIDLKNYSLGCPWKYDVTAYNFRFPEEVIAVSDIDKIDYFEDIQSLVISCDLENYDFIAKMINLRQLYIYSGNNLQDISFVRNLNALSHLYIADSHIDSLDPLKELIAEQKRQFDTEKDFHKRLFMIIDAVCVNSSNELDGDQLLESGAYITEIIVNDKNYVMY